MHSLYRSCAALVLVIFVGATGCEKQTSQPAPPADSGINDSGTGNAPNTGDGEPSAAG
jgi:hypothetical protein